MVIQDVLRAHELNQVNWCLQGICLHLDESSNLEKKLDSLMLLLLDGNSRKEHSPLFDQLKAFD